MKVGRHTIDISHEEKLYFPKDKITKGDVVNYYRDIAPYMVPHMKNRPISMVRTPDGITGESFFQKNIGEHYPAWVKRVVIKKADGVNITPVCNDAATLVYLANQACLTPHLWLSKTDKLHYPDRMIFDLDPSPGITFSKIKATALAFQRVLEEFGLVPFVMTTGSRGLHIVVPIKRELEFHDMRAVSVKLAELVIAQDPKYLTKEVRKEKRAGKLFIDCNRNAFAQTSVAPYAVRAKPKASIAAPLHWNELKNPKLSPQSFNIKNIFARLKKGGDPWKDINKHTKSLKKVQKRLETIGS